MADLTEQQIAEFDKLNTQFENASFDLGKFQSLLSQASQELKGLVESGYKNPEERKEMAANDAIYFKVKNLETDVASFVAKKDLYELQVNQAKKAGYKTPLERIAAEAKENAEKKAEKLAATQSDNESQEVPNE